jgi:hypothetical protein
MTAKKYHKGEQKRNRGSPLHNEERRRNSERNVINDNFCVCSKEQSQTSTIKRQLFQLVENMFQ